MKYQARMSRLEHMEFFTLFHELECAKYTRVITDPAYPNVGVTLEPVSQEGEEKLTHSMTVGDLYRRGWGQRFGAIS